jgi:2'-5' RNA ligase
MYRDEYQRKVSEQLGYDVPTKEEIFKIGHYHMLPTIEKMHASRATHRIVWGGNRAGKSEAAAWEIIPYLLFGDTVGWCVSANYSMSMVIEQKVESILSERFGFTRAQRVDMLEHWQYTFSTHDMTLRLFNGATLQVKSVENPDSMHAVSVDYIVLDEANLCPAAIYDTRLIPRLVDAGGWILSIGTLENAAIYSDWFREYGEIGQTENDFSIESWKHPTKDNYHVFIATGGETSQELASEYHNNAARIEETNPDITWPLKKGDRVIIMNIDLNWLEQERKRIDPEIYAARYEAEPGGNLYLVYPSYRPEIYCHPQRAKFDPALPVYLSIDPGGTYAVSAIQLKRFSDIPGPRYTHGQHVCIIDEVYYQTTVTTDEVYRECASRPWWGNVGQDPKMVGVIDVRAKEQRRAWEQLLRSDEVIEVKTGLRACNVNISDGIRTLQHLLDESAFWNNPRNKYTNLEFKRYQFATPGYSKLETDDPRKGGKPKDAWNHLLKADSYFLVNMFGVYRRVESPVYSGGRYG